jgi:periplasmic mercuric ion binding protein
MKPHKNILFAFIFVFITLGCNKTNQQKIKTDSAKIVESSTISLPSIKCGMCVNTIKEAIKKTEGVETANVNLSAKIVMVGFDKSKTDLSKIEKAIADAGYDANNLPRNIQAYENLPTCCK